MASMLWTQCLVSSLIPLLFAFATFNACRAVACFPIEFTATCNLSRVHCAPAIASGERHRRVFVTHGKAPDHQFRRRVSA